MWRDDLFFFWRSTDNLEKSRPTKKFWPPQKEILPPLEQSSSCGTAYNAIPEPVVDLEKGGPSA